MLVDIFARRYGSVPLRNTFEQRDSRLLVQAFRILAEDIYPYYRNGKDYIDNLAAKRNALITPWEAAALKDFFTHVRNPFGHGPGSEAMPKLTRQQTEWAIELCMSWIKNLIRRA